jgi:hypothetical protein
MTLSYLFTCLFKNGTSIVQTQHDTSPNDPSKSAFYDVLQNIDDVLSFKLSDGTNTCSVHLQDGHFEVNGMSFFAHEAIPGAQYRLIYFRRNQQMTVSGGANSHTVEYHLGWQTTVDGKNYQQTISVR